MKTLSKALLFSALAFYLSACSKNETAETLLPMSGNAIAGTNGTMETLDANSTKAFLINKDWKYFEYYNNYPTSAIKLAYKAGKPANLLNLGAIVLRFNSNNTYSETNALGQVVGGTYTISTNGFLVTTTSSMGTSTYNITLITNSVFAFFPNGSTTNLGHMRAPLPTSDTTQTIAQMLVGKTWMYTKYFQNYSSSVGTVGFFSGTSGLPLNLADTRVTYFTNGDYTETSSAGGTLTGKWSVTGNQLSIKVNGVTFVSTFKVIQPYYWEWLSSDGQNYGVMEPTL